MVLMLSGTVDLPAVGPVSKRGLVFGGGAAAAVTGFLWWRHRTAAAAAPVDPADLGDAGAADLTDATDTGVSGPSAGPVPTADAPAGTGFVTNAQWTQAAESALIGTVDAGALSAALGRYVTGSEVTPDQELLIQQAISVEGYPPVDGPGGYPPAIRTQPSAGQTTPVTLPTPATPHAVSVAATSIKVSVPAVPGANLYGWYVNGSGLGWTGSPAKTIGFLQPKHSYSITVQARHNDAYSAHSPALTVTTPAK